MAAPLGTCAPPRSTARLRTPTPLSRRPLRRGRGASVRFARLPAEVRAGSPRGRTPSLRDNGPDRSTVASSGAARDAPADTIDWGGEAMQAVLEVLTADEQAQVHERTLKVLWEHGMRVDPDEGRRALAAAGAQVDEATRMVRFPRALVEEALRLAPKRFSLGGRRAGLLLPPQRRRVHAARRRRGDDAARPPHRRAPRPHARGLDRGDDPHRRLRRRRPVLVALPPPVRRPGSARASSTT